MHRYRSGEDPKGQPDASEAHRHIEDMVVRLTRLLLGLITSNPVLQGLIASGLSIALAWLSGHSD